MMAACAGTDSRPAAERDATTTTIDVPWKDAEFIDHVKMDVCDDDGDCYEQEVLIVRIPWRDGYKVDCTYILTSSPAWDCDYNNPVRGER
jgi:hypothetical protein